jgi:hypothetical protein
MKNKPSEKKEFEARIAVKEVESCRKKLEMLAEMLRLNEQDAIAPGLAEICSEMMDQLYNAHAALAELVRS